MTWQNTFEKSLWWPHVASVDFSGRKILLGIHKTLAAPKAWLFYISICHLLSYWLKRDRVSMKGIVTSQLSDTAQGLHAEDPTFSLWHFKLMVLQ